LTNPGPDYTAPDPCINNYMGAFKDFATDKGKFIDTTNMDKIVKLSIEQYNLLVTKHHLKPVDDKAKEITQKSKSQ